MNEGTMKKWLALFLFFIFLYDLALDSSDIECQKQASAQCHVCICQAHTTNPPTVTSYKVPDVNPKCIEVAKTDLIERLLDKSFFHPPKFSA